MNASPKNKSSQNKAGSSSPKPNTNIPAGGSFSPKPNSQLRPSPMYAQPKGASPSFTNVKKAFDFGDSQKKKCQTKCCFDMYDLVLLLIVLAQVYFIPFMKVEERFHADAVFDLLNPPSSPENWAHMDFKPVPRTLLGSLWLYLTVYPAQRLLQYCQTHGYLSSGLCLAKISLYLMRMTLGSWFVIALACLRKSIRSLSDLPLFVDRFFALIIGTQFHLLYYSSRPLGNTFALIIALFGYSAWLQRHYGRLMAASLLSTIVFRFDFAVLWISIFLFELVHLRGPQLRNIFFYKVCLAPIFLALAIGIDSHFYGRWVWPEFESFRYNVIDNRSSDYGISSVSWYFTHALPKALGTTSAWFFLSLFVSPKVWARIGLPALTLVLAFSFLPHKELRFIFPALPLFNLVAAVSMASGWQSRYRLPRFFFRLLIIGSLAINLLVTGVSLWASAWNYPGGYAAEQLHAMESPSTKVWVHRDIYTGLSGESPYSRCHAGWQYDTNENYTRASDYRSFTHILTGSPSTFSNEFKVVAEEQGFDSITVPPSIHTLIKKLKDSPLDLSLLTTLKHFAIQELTLAKLKQSFSELLVLKPKVFIMKRK